MQHNNRECEAIRTVAGIWSNARLFVVTSALLTDNSVHSFFFFCYALFQLPETHICSRIWQSIATTFSHPKICCVGQCPTSKSHSIEPDPYLTMTWLEITSPDETTLSALRDQRYKKRWQIMAEGNDPYKCCWYSSNPSQAQNIWSWRQ